MTKRDRTPMIALRRRGVMSALAAYAVAAFAMVLTLLPLYWLFLISTKTPVEAFKSPPDLIYVPDFSKYLAIWQSGEFAPSFVNSLIVVTFGVSLGLLVATPAAYALIRFRIRRGRFVRLWLVVAYTSPEFLVILPTYVLYQQIGLFDTQIGLAIIYQLYTLPFAVWMLQSFFSEVPAELGDAARIDGCSDLGVLVRVYLPLAAPGIAATAILLGVNIWNEITIALSLTFGQSKTVQVAVADYRGYAQIQWQEMASAAITAVIPMVVFAGIAQRYLVKGLTFGAVK